VSKDNLELGCSLIQKAVIERALAKVDNDPALLEALNSRRRARQAGKQFRDESNAHYIERLPEILQPSPQGLTQS
jgi:CCR4-NOT transcription complex subunit 1